KSTCREEILMITDYIFKNNTTEFNNTNLSLFIQNNFSIEQLNLLFIAWDHLLKNKAILNKDFYMQLGNYKLYLEDGKNLSDVLNKNMNNYDNFIVLVKAIYKNQFNKKDLID